MFDDADGNIRRRHQELCVSLNMDRDAAEEAWQNYDTNRQNYTLEGDQQHWLCCALYVACRKATVPSVGRPESSVEGNCVSLTNLLRQGNLSLTQFLSKAKKWAEMSKLPPEFRGQIDRLERNFAVSMVIFKKFQPIFLAMFQDPAEEESPKPVPRSRKQRTIPCTPAKVFDFGWTLFVCVKGGLRDVADDLVSSYHLLLACCDLLFSNALISLRKDLLNPSFAGIPKNFIDKDYEPPTEPPCIIDVLCEEHDGIPLEAKLIKEYPWRQHMSQLFEERVLKGNALTFTGLLDPNNFDANYKAVVKAYKEYVLRAGDFDERVFLDDDENLGIGSSMRSPGCGGNGLGDFTERMQAQRNRSQQLGPMHHLVPLTPLTGRKYLTGKESASITPVSTATQSVSRLQSLLCGRQATPSEALIAIFKSVSNNPQAQIEERIAEMGRQFCKHHTQSQSNDDSASGSSASKTNQQKPGSIDFAKRRLQFAERLYYKLLENILIGEKKKKPSLDLSVLLEHQVFHETLFACCLEIVIYSYNSQRTFPWILDVLGIEAYYFYKVIELIVLAEDQLSRDMVKHLNFIEEQILESMAWKSDSPVWDAIAESGLPVPSCEDVSLPGQISSDSPNGTVEPTSVYTASSSPLPNPMIRRLAMGTVNDRPALKHMLHQSPGSSALERFHSPLPPGQARKRLFVDTLPPSSTTHPPTTSSSVMSSAATSSSLSNTSNSAPANVMVKPGQSLLQSTAAKAVAINIQTIQGENGERYIPISYMPSPGSVIIQAHHAVGSVQTPGMQTGSISLRTGQMPSRTATTPTAIMNTERKPKRTGSLGLFFRKFYHLAWVRMQELCKELHIDENDLRRKIWTFFEHTIINHTDFMCDRHVDQILMCSVYVICRVTKNEKTFTDIMGCYRKQPQCASHIYRSVLLSSSRKQLKKGDASSTDKENQGKGSAVEERGDLIRFYNTVYVLRVKNFAHRFSGESVSNDNLTLSPLPMARSQSLAQQVNPAGGNSLSSSPCRRVSEHHSVYIRSLERPVAPVTPGSTAAQFPQSPQHSQPLSYSFSRSPAKDLRDINLMIQLDAARANSLGDASVSSLPSSLTRVRRIGKRLLADDPSISTCGDGTGNGEADGGEGSDTSKSSPPKQSRLPEPPIVARKIQDMMGDRMGQAQE
ncbi:retinoblastoma-like protein 1 isoform X1 [Hetaerina americana]|uniref:retinoblastoma-like protein 1 isoform X1 n=1 Tax=Hetaerina americana TaxID=62018 RepID=UPI003A7F3E52